jgi:tRNA G18 (ribose-2'-O)-methylase SpoU
MEQNSNSTLINNDNNNTNLNKPDFYLLIFNLQSKHNVGTLIRSASAFNCKQIIVLGSNKKVLKKFFGSQGTVKKMDFLFLDTFEELRKFCDENKIYVCGVEIGNNSVPVHKQPFKGNTLFILGNEGAGMNQKQKDFCDHFVYIQQYSNKTGSLNVAIAGSIIFHHFGIWAGYTEADYTQEKYDVGKKQINVEEGDNSTNINDNL